MGVLCEDGEGGDGTFVVVVIDQLGQWVEEVLYIAEMWFACSTIQIQE